MGREMSDVRIGAGSHEVEASVAMRILFSAHCSALVRFGAVPVHHIAYLHVCHIRVLRHTFCASLLVLYRSVHPQATVRDYWRRLNS